MMEDDRGNDLAPVEWTERQVDNMVIGGDDAELFALQLAYGALKALPDDQQSRVVWWLGERLKSDQLKRAAERERAEA